MIINVECFLVICMCRLCLAGMCACRLTKQVVESTGINIIAVATDHRSFKAEIELHLKSFKVCALVFSYCIYCNKL